MFGKHPIQRQLDRLDDRMSELSRIDSYQRIGRSEGEAYQMQLRSFYEGHGPKPDPMGRTPAYRLLRHLEREWNRTNRSWK